MVISPVIGPPGVSLFSGSPILFTLILLFASSVALDDRPDASEGLGPGGSVISPTGPVRVLLGASILGGITTDLSSLTGFSPGGREIESGCSGIAGVG